MRSRVFPPTTIGRRSVLRSAQNSPYPKRIRSALVHLWLLCNRRAPKVPSRLFACAPRGGAHSFPAAAISDSVGGFGCYRIIPTAAVWHVVHISRYIATRGTRLCGVVAFLACVTQTPPPSPSSSLSSTFVVYCVPYSATCVLCVVCTSFVLRVVVLRAQLNNFACVYTHERGTARAIIVTVIVCSVQRC